MKLTDLNPRILGHGGEGVTFSATGLPVPRREGVALAFDCPCGCGGHGMVYFSNPLDGGPPVGPPAACWDRTGDTLETMTLTPSILQTKPPGCGWHGYLTNGVMVPC